MVGHTGVFEAAVKAGGSRGHLRGPRGGGRAGDGRLSLLLTADHGNADKMYGRRTALPLPPTPPTPCPSASSDYPCQLREGGRLADIAPTMLKILGLEQPAEMTGESIIL